MKEKRKLLSFSDKNLFDIENPKKFHISFNNNLFLNALGRIKLSRADSLHSPLHLLLLLVASLWVLVLFGLLREPGLDYGSPKHVNGANRCEQKEKPKPVAVKRKDLSCRRENYGVFDVPSWTEEIRCCLI